MFKKRRLWLAQLQRRKIKAKRMYEGATFFLNIFFKGMEKMWQLLFCNT